MHMKRFRRERFLRVALPTLVVCCEEDATPGSGAIGVRPLPAEAPARLRDQRKATASPRACRQPFQAADSATVHPTGAVPRIASPM